MITKYTAKTLLGLENILSEELKTLGASDIVLLNRAVSFTADLETMYKINYCSRLALSILKPIAEFDIEEQEDLYDNLYKVAWEKLFGIDHSIMIDAVLFDSVFTHSQYASFKVKDAIVDRFRKLFNQRPDVDKINPMIRIDLYMMKNHCIISLDSSGSSLFKRGYRISKGFAPINEVLGAGLIQLAGWDKQKPFYDPMCGSGTLLIEAAMYACNIPAQYYRTEDYCFQNWNDYDALIFRDVKKKAAAQICDPECEIFGSDVSINALENAKENITGCKLHKDITLHQADFLTSTPPAPNGLIISNPPYGERLQPEDIVSLYQGFGDVLKQKYTGYDAWFISSNMDALKMLGLHPSKKITLFNGKLECKFEKFEIY